MGFNIKPGMSIWNNTTKRYKKEYHIYVAKMEQLKFENDRKLAQQNKKRIFNKPLKGLNKNANVEEKKWYSWMEKWILE